MRVPLACIGLREVDIIAAKKVLESGNLTMGSQVAKFERLMADYLKVKYFIMVNSGSSANLAIFEALLRPSKGVPRLKNGDGVLVPAVAWPTTIWPIIQLGLRPVFVDVDPNSIALDLEKAQIEIDKDSRIKAIFPIHPLGYGLDGDDLDSFCSRNNLHQVNDVCESLGSWRGEKHAGTSGLAASFSFYFSHHITTMEGGGIATNDSEIADDLRSIRSHGWSRDRSDLESWRVAPQDNLNFGGISGNDDKFQFITTGYNIRPMEIQAAIGVEQLKDLDNFVLRRRSGAISVRRKLEGSIFEVVDANTLSNPKGYASHSWMLICIKVLKKLNEREKSFIQESLKLADIETRPVLTGNFLNQQAMLKFPEMPSGKLFPVAEEISSNYFLVGAHHDLTDKQIAHLSHTLRSIADQISLGL